MITGRDATKAFVTGKFTEEGLIDNISDFETEKFLEVENWIKFYEETYPCVGKSINYSCFTYQKYFSNNFFELMTISSCTKLS